MGGEFKCKIPVILSNKREEGIRHTLQGIPMSLRGFERTLRPV